MKTPTWRELAAILAERVEHQASRAGSECPHPAAEAEPDDCAFCADRAAYLLWRRRERGGA